MGRGQPWWSAWRGGAARSGTGSSSRRWRAGLRSHSTVCSTSAAWAGSTYPRSFVLWAALPLFAAGVLAWQWPRVHWWRRIATFASVPALLAFGAMEINMHYAYLPTVGDLVGAPMIGQVSASQILRPPSIVQRIGYRHSQARMQLPDQGVVAQITIPGTISHFHARDGYVWLPPAYFQSPRPHLPVIMLIPGTPSATWDWLRGGGALGTANRWAAMHHGWAPALVFPDANGHGNGDTECVDSVRGNAETYLTIDVPAFMRAHFGVAMNAGSWAVVGLSEGGTCALELASRHPGTFATFGDFSGDAAPITHSLELTLKNLFAGSMTAYQSHVPAHWFAFDAAHGVEGDIAVGSGDQGSLRMEQRVVQAAEAAHLHVVFDVIPHGGHDFHTWAVALKDAFPWIVTRLDTQTRPVCLTSRRQPTARINNPQAQHQATRHATTACLH